MRNTHVVICIAAVTLASSPDAIAQRVHRITEKGVLTPQPATSTPEIANSVTIEVVGDQRIIRSNGIPNHKTGQFPSRGNPNRITAQTHEYRVPANPKVADRLSPMRGEFGVAINGVPFDPGAAEFYDGEPGWQYEPLSGAIALGIDVSHAHVQPNGKYHYHGLPTGLLDSVKVESGKHSPLIGWAADGFPIYAVYGYSNPEDPKSPVQKLTSSYQLKKGNRPAGNAPGGTYDGTFVHDYEYVAGSGDLDECNGRQTRTPEFPDGTYAYFMTEEWPVVPRNYRGTPSSDFQHGRGPGGQGGPMAGGPGRRGPGGPGRGGPPKPGEVLPSFVKDAINLNADQVGQLDTLQKIVDVRLTEILHADQKQQLESVGPPGRNRDDGPPGRGGPGGPRGFGNGPPPGGPPQFGEVVPSFVRESLHLDTEQTSKLDALQQTVTERLAEILTDKQQQQLQHLGPAGRGGPEGRDQRGQGGRRPGGRPR